MPVFIRFFSHKMVKKERILFSVNEKYSKIFVQRADPMRRIAHHANRKRQLQCLRVQRGGSRGHGIIFPALQRLRFCYNLCHLGHQHHYGTHGSGGSGARESRTRPRMPLQMCPVQSLFQRTRNRFSFLWRGFYRTCASLGRENRTLLAFAFLYADSHFTGIGLQRILYGSQTRMEKRGHPDGRASGSHLFGLLFALSASSPRRGICLYGAGAWRCDRRMRLLPDIAYRFSA